MKTITMCALGLIFFTAGASGAEPAPTAAATPAAINWDGMSKKERKAYMKATVLPAAKKLFVESDPKKPKKSAVTCAFCHGGGAEKDFKMPNPDLPKLPSSPQGFQALKEKKPDMMTFMATKVKPAMAGLLNEPEVTMTNPKGFGCYDCHTKDDGAAKAAEQAPAKTPAPAPAK